MGTRQLRILPYIGKRAYQYYIGGLKVNAKRQRLFFYRRKVREGEARGADKQDAQGRRGCPCPQPRFSGARSEVFGASEALQQNHMGLKRSGAPSVSRLGRITAFGIRSLLITSPNIRTHRNSPWKWDIRRLG